MLFECNYPAAGTVSTKNINSKWSKKYRQSESFRDDTRSPRVNNSKFQLIAYKWTRDAKTEFLETDDMIKALEYVITSMPTKHINQVTFGKNDQAETHLNQFILRSFYGIDGKPRYYFLTVYTFHPL